MVFPSKKDLWMGILIWSLITGCLWIFYESFFVQFDIFGIIIMGIGMYLLIAIWFNTRYKIEEDILKISFGPMKKSICIKDIQSIRNTTNPFAAPALSMYRIEIIYGYYETVAISPKNKKQFINELQMKNPDIKILDS